MRCILSGLPEIGKDQNMLTDDQRLSMLAVPKGPVNVVIDSDTYNEINNQFAIAYSLKYPVRLCAKGKAWSRVIWDVTAVAWLLTTAHGLC